MSYYGIEGGSGGGGSTGPNQQIIAREQIGPSSYATGGFEIDFSSWLSAINFVSIIPKKGSRGSLGATDFVIDLDASAAGKFKIKLLRRRYSRVSAVGNVQGQPGGVTVQSSSGQTSSSESAHIHSIAHDHPSFTSGAAVAGGAGVLSQLLGINFTTHTHTLDLPNFTGDSGAGTAHNHTDNTLYAHSHGITQTATDFTLNEVANGTDLSSTIFYLLATGVSV